MSNRTSIRAYGQLLELVPFDEATRLQVLQSSKPTEKRRSQLRKNLVLFVVCVAIPTLVAILYFGFVAADRYEVETRFVLRSSTKSLAGNLSSFLKSTGVTKASDDAHVVRNYILSRDAMRDVNETLDLRQLFQRSSADFFWRFPNIFTPQGTEGLFRQYKRFVSVRYDQSTGVIELSTQAFRAVDAQLLASALIDAAEKLVNRLNARANRDIMAFALQEVERMRERTINAQERLTAYRTRESLVDPNLASLENIQSIARLSLEAAVARMQLTEIERASPQSPQLAPLRGRVMAIEGEIAKNRRILAGDETSLATKISEYERLVLEREFSERALVSAFGGVEMARMEAQKQQVYLERVAQPFAPDYPMYPYRWLSIAAVFLAGYMLYRLCLVLIADTKRHSTL